MAVMTKLDDVFMMDTCVVEWPLASAWVKSVHMMPLKTKLSPKKIFVGKPHVNSLSNKGWMGVWTTYGSYHVLDDILRKVQMEDSSNALCKAGRQVRRSPTAHGGKTLVFREAKRNNKEGRPSTRNQSHVQLGKDTIESRASPRRDGQHNPLVLSSPAHLVVIFKRFVLSFVDGVWEQ